MNFSEDQINNTIQILILVTTIFDKDLSLEPRPNIKLFRVQKSIICKLNNNLTT